MALSQKPPDDHLSSVESVESVKKNDLTHYSIDRLRRPIPEDYSTKVNKPSVESVTKNDLHGYFSTLSTEMEKQSVGNCDLLSKFSINDLRTVPQIPQIPQGKAGDSLVFLTNDGEARRLIFGWLRVVLSEGHIEASQPSVGKIVGWPSRGFAIESLFVDFNLWCRKRGVSRWSAPKKALFFSVLDEVLNREGDRYTFPPLDECRAKFTHLEAKYEST